MSWVLGARTAFGKGTDLRTSIRRFATLVAGALLASTLSGVAGAAPLAQAGGSDDGAGVDTRVTLRATEGRRAVRFEGRVFTVDGQEAEDCTAGRRVVLYRVTRRGDVVREDATYSTSSSDYQLRLADAPRGKYFAKVLRTLVADAYGDLIVCQADVSPTVAI